MDGEAAGSEIQVLAREGSMHLEVKRSQFDAVARAVARAEDLPAFLREVRHRYPQARHVVYGWVGPAGSGLARSSDDREPPGTGGLRCLAALHRFSVSGTAVAVARVFGGVLLGAANLGRAYGDAAQGAVSNGGIRVLVPTVTLDVRAPLDALGRIEGMFTERGIEADIRYEIADPIRGTGAVAIWVVAVSVEVEDRIRLEVAERTQGRAEVVRTGGIELR